MPLLAAAHGGQIACEEHLASSVAMKWMQSSMSPFSRINQGALGETTSSPVSGMGPSEEMGDATADGERGLESASQPAPSDAALIFQRHVSLTTGDSSGAFDEIPTEQLPPSTPEPISNTFSTLCETHSSQSTPRMAFRQVLSSIQSPTLTLPGGSPPAMHNEAWQLPETSFARDRQATRVIYAMRLGMFK